MTERDPDLALLERAIAKSGLSANQFAENILIRDRRTVARWLSGELALPKEVRKWLAKQQLKQP